MEGNVIDINNEHEDEVVVPGDPAHELVRELMRDRGWRIPRLAKALGIKEFIVRRWLNGKRRITVEELVQIAQLGGFSLDKAYKLNPRRSELQEGSGAFHGELSKSLATIFLTVGQALSEQTGVPLQVVDSTNAAGKTQGRFVSAEPTPATAKDRLDDRARMSLGFITDGLRTRRTGTR